MRPRSRRVGPAAPTTPTTTRSRPADSSHTRASLTIARKLARRSYHVLRELGPAALEPVRP